MLILSFFIWSAEYIYIYMYIAVSAWLVPLKLYYPCSSRYPLFSFSSFGRWGTTCSNRGCYSIFHLSSKMFIHLIKKKKFNFCLFNHFDHFWTPHSIFGVFKDLMISLSLSSSMGFGPINWTKEIYELNLIFKMKIIVIKRFKVKWWDNFNLAVVKEHALHEWMERWMTSIFIIIKHRFWKIHQSLKATVNQMKLIAIFRISFKQW